MSKCRYCKRRGLFLSTNSSGLCKNCAPAVEMEVNSRLRVMEDSMRLAHEGKTFGTRLSRCDLVIEHAVALMTFEREGIRVMTPDPSVVAREYQRLRDTIIMEEAGAAADKSISKADVAGTPRSRETALASGLLKIQEIAANLESPAEADHLVRRHKNLLHRAKLGGFLDAARKAEFKGNAKKAIDQYQEALYFILNDDIPDSEQKKEIAEIEVKIASLSREGAK